MNDFRVLFKYVQYDDLFDVSKGCGDDIPPYLLGDQGYSPINWIMTPLKEEKIHTNLNFFYNWKDKCSRFIVDSILHFLKEIVVVQVRFGCCFYSQHLHFILFQNMLRNEDEISIECLFCIIEL